MAKKKYRQVPDALRDLEDEASKLDAKRLESKPLTDREKKRYAKLNKFFDWLVVIGFYHRLNSLSPFTEKKGLDEILSKTKKKLRLKRSK